MLQRLITALVESKNEAADDLLLEAMNLGNEKEKQVALEALIQRKTIRGLGEVIGRFESLPATLKIHVLREIRHFHHAVREAARSPEAPRRLNAMKMIALARQGKLAYVLSENMHDSDEAVARAAIDALVTLAKWVASETRAIQAHARGVGMPAEGESFELPPTQREVMEQRPEIEAAVTRAMEVHRGRFGQELLRSALLLCDWAGSKTLAILHTAKHHGQSSMVRRLQQAPAAEHAEAFLLGGSHGGLRAQFGSAFSHIAEAQALDAILRKTHWLKDHQLQLCVHQVTRGVWWGDSELISDIQRRPPGDAAMIGEWIGVSGLADIAQDERMSRLLDFAKDDFAARLRLLRVAMRRPRGASVQLLRAMLSDSDERIVRMAARDILRRKPADFENILLQLMTNAPESVRRVIGRSLGKSGFDNFWDRFDRLDKETRKSAGRAMLKILPDATQRLGRMLTSGPVPQRLKALEIAHELELASQLRAQLVQLSADTNPKLRSKAVFVLGGTPDSATTDVLLDRVLNDNDPRVRANAIEVLDDQKDPAYIPVLTKLARASNSRERANAIKALHHLRVGSASNQLLNMLKDERPEHRVSALWALRQIGWWQMLQEVGKLAKDDTNTRVRRYALGVLRGAMEMAQQQKDQPQDQERKAG